MDRTGYFSLPLITWAEVQRLGHKTRAGIHKPKGSSCVASIVSNAGESNPSYEDYVGDDLVLWYAGRGRGKDQTLDDFDNRALLESFKCQVPVRVFVGGHDRYRDWGYWEVTGLERRRGSDGFRKLVYRLVPHPRSLSLSS
jgi:hypothetical protein